jgi:hypothetical protein
VNIKIVDFATCVLVVQYIEKFAQSNYIARAEPGTLACHGKAQTNDSFDSSSLVGEPHAKFQAGVLDRASTCL